MPKSNSTKYTISTIIFLIILSVGSWLRLYNIPATLQFLGDQGRDALLVSRIFTEADPVFIGPVTSVGNMYLGPMYYYFMLPWLWLSYPSPVGPAYAVAILSIATIWLIYKFGKKMIGQKPALLASFLFAFSNVAVTYARFSWNPNPAPLITTVLVYALYKALNSSLWYWLVVGVCVSILIQLHYVFLLAVAATGVIWFWQLFDIFTKKKTELSKFAMGTVGAALIVISTLTPLILFDSQHQWLNARAFGALFTKEDAFARQGSTPLTKIAQTVKETHGRGMHILFETNIGQKRTLNTILLLIVLSIMAWRLKSHRKEDSWLGEAIISLFLVIGIVGTAAYEQNVFDHYILYLMPVSSWILAIVLTDLWHRQIFAKIGVISFLLYFILHNASRYPLQKIGWSIDDISRTADTIYGHVKPGEKYNIVLMSGTGDIDGQNYRYYLETTDRPAVKTEQRGEVETLFIINEDQEIEKVTDSPIYEIVVFPDKEIKEVYTIPGGPEITILRKDS